MSIHLLAHTTSAQGLQNPVYDKNGNLYVVSRESGLLFTAIPAEQDGKQNEDANPLELISHTSPGPHPCALLPQEDEMNRALIADAGLCAIVANDIGIEKDAPDNVEWIVEEYEGKPFLGPNSLCTDSQGTLYFTDSGLIGSTTLADPQGSLFCINTSQILRPILYECLASPSAIAIGPDDHDIFIAEQLKNRILRVTQKPAGVYITTVWAQLSGGIGPSSLCYDRTANLLYVGQMDFASVNRDVQSNGRILVLDGTTGTLKQEFNIPGPEVSGLTLTPDGKNLIVTENSTSSIYAIEL